MGTVTSAVIDKAVQPENDFDVLRDAEDRARKAKTAKD
jgi:hypothetical protein